MTEEERDAFIPAHAAPASEGETTSASDDSFVPAHAAPAPVHVEGAPRGVDDQAVSDASPEETSSSGASSPQKASPADTADLIEAARAAAAELEARAAADRAAAAIRAERAELLEEVAEAPAPANDGNEPVAAVERDERVAPTGPDETADATDPADPGDTADLTEAAEAAAAAVHKDLGSTQSFEPITDEPRVNADSTYDAGTTTQLMWGARSDVGCVRTHNEDSYLVQSPLFAVCDGMGGHAAGEVASSIAVETIAKTAPKAADPALLAAAVEAANAAVIEAAVNGLGKPGMGCTATVAYLEGTTIAIAHVGDSRAYLLHEGTLIRATHDHSYVEELVDAGEITADEARVHPNRSVITRALGSDPNMYADHFQIGVETGDRLILCSDGLSSMVPDGEIERIATQSATAQICTDNLVDAALAAGGTDNVTVIVVDLVDDGKLKEVARKRRRNAILAVAALLIVVVLGALFTFASIAGSVYLGVKDGFVAVYTGVPHSFLGLELHWLQDKSTVEIEDLPEDTQGRLRDGIPQDSVDQANETISKYRKQIYEEQTKAAESAGIVRDGAASGSATAPATTGDGANGAANASAASPSSSSQTGSAADAAASQNQVPSTATPQGGQSQ